MVVSGCKAPSSVAYLVKDSRISKEGSPLGFPAFTRFAPEPGALQPLTATYNLLTSPYKPLTNNFLDCRVTKRLEISKVTKSIEISNLFVTLQYPKSRFF